MKAVAVTGGLGSGKSTVLKFVSSSCVAGIDCDAIVSRLYKEKAVQKRLKKAFGTASRKRLSEIVFSSKTKRKKLEKILHPLVLKHLKKILSLCKKQGKKLAFVEVPLLFEAKWQGKFDSIVFVKAGKRQCLKRLESKGIPKKQAILRMKAQLPAKKKVKKSDYTIDNSGSLIKTRKQTKRLLKKILAEKRCN